MTKYCPVCESEFQDDLSLCPDDGETLSIAPSVRIDRTTSVDLFLAANAIEAECVVQLLADLEIPSLFFQNQVSIIPNLGDQHYVVAVRPIDIRRATEAINTAQSDGIISNDGLFL